MNVKKHCSKLLADLKVYLLIIEINKKIFEVKHKLIS